MSILVDIPVITNLFENIPVDLDQEFFEKLLNDEYFYLERIVSEGHTTPEGTWLCEDSNEWVILLSGSAKLAFKSDGIIRHMNPGDYCIIPAGTHHQIEWTDPNVKTVWLALHYVVRKKD